MGLHTSSSLVVSDPQEEVATTLMPIAFQLLYAKFYVYFNVKWVFLSALSIFEIGSIICAVSNSSNTFIAGRAVAGLGAAGLFSGATAVVVLVAPLTTRPVINGMIGAMFGVCSILGPLIGGVLAEKSTWRWCFWINCEYTTKTAFCANVSKYHLGQLLRLESFS